MKGKGPGKKSERAQKSKRKKAQGALSSGHQRKIAKEGKRKEERKT